MTRIATRKAAAGAEVEEAGDEGQQLDAPPMPGGSPGIPGADQGATPNRAHRISRPEDMVVGDLTPLGRGAPQPKQYVVVHGGRVMKDGLSYQLGGGRVINDHTYDVPKLRQQGIVLRALEPGEVG